MASPAENSHKHGFGTILLHSDDAVALGEKAVSPSISVSTTYRHVYGKREEETTGNDISNPLAHFYSRYTTPTRTRCEMVLSKICEGNALTYSSGLQAAYAAIVHCQPQRVAISEGYMGVYGILDIYKRSNKDLVLIGLDDPFQPGDLCWVETPLNPTGEARDLQHYADKIHAVGGKLVVDSTFGPPPLQNPFDFGADYVHHSGTKYLGGHSDLLCGVLVVKSNDVYNELYNDRIDAGGVMGSLEQWLLLRSLRTLHLRVPRQSASATKLAQWLHQLSLTPHGQSFDGAPGGLIVKVLHASLQGVNPETGFDPKKQMPGGFSGTFSLLMANSDLGKELPFAFKIFTAATSLGGVESLTEQRVVSHPNSDPRLIRVSVGLEEVEDLIEDFRQGLNAVTRYLVTPDV